MLWASGTWDTVTTLSYQQEEDSTPSLVSILMLHTTDQGARTLSLHQSTSLIQISDLQRL